MKMIGTPELLRAAKAAAAIPCDYLLEPELARKVDPDGRHALINLALVCDDRAARCKALLKLRDQVHPHVLILDVPLAFYNAAERVEEPVKKD